MATTTARAGAVRLHGEDYSLVFGYIIDLQPRPTAPVPVDDLPGPKRSPTLSPPT